MLIYIDMDGVIVNLGKVLTREVNTLINNPKNITCNDTLQIVEEIICHQDKNNYIINLEFMKNIFVKKDLVGLDSFERLVSDLSYKPLIKDIDLWASLPKENNADELIDFLSKKFGKDNLRILSAPVDLESIIGKKIWLKNHYPFLLNNAFFEKEKHIHCKPKDILIDDRPKNIKLWRKKDGFGILHESIERTIYTLKYLSR